ncbi:MAG: hypothetical protein ACPGZP_05665 [Panacagrimonas sp.]
MIKRLIGVAPAVVLLRQARHFSIWLLTSKLAAPALAFTIIDVNAVTERRNPRRSKG